MLNFIDNVLCQFESCFSRKASFRWFVAITIGFILRSNFSNFFSCTIFSCQFSFEISFIEIPKSYPYLIMDTIHKDKKIHRGQGTGLPFLDLGQNPIRNLADYLCGQFDSVKIL